MSPKLTLCGTLVALLSLTACVTLEPRKADTFVGVNPAPAGGEATATAPAAPPAVPGGPLALTVTDAVLLSIQNNRAFVVERFNPALKQTVEEQALAVFDPVAAGQLTLGRTRVPLTGGDTFTTTDSESVGLTLDQLFPLGTSVEAGLDTSFNPSPQDDATRLYLSATQPLLRGAGVEANLASIHQAAIDTQVSEYELRGFAESLVAQVEEACWDYALAARQIQIYESSLAIAKQQLDETQERIKVGQMAEIELAAARSEMALREEALINARSSLAEARLQLLRLVNPPGEKLWERDLSVVNVPRAPTEAVGGAEEHVGAALRLRPDLNEARLQIKRGNIEVVRTKNGLLPKLDLFITLGKSGYSNSFGGVGGLAGGGYDLAVGIKAQLPIFNRDATAVNRRAILGFRQSTEALENLIQLAQVDVRTAWLEVSRLQKQIVATGVTLKLQEEKLRAETEKFRVGKSTSFLVAQAQRDLLAAQIDEIQATVNCLKSLVELYRLDGSLLERRGISAPGHGPVELGGSSPGPIGG